MPKHYRAVGRVLLLLFLAFCAFGVEETESDWSANQSSTRSSDRNRRGRIGRTAQVSNHAFRSVGGQNSSSSTYGMEAVVLDLEYGAFANEYAVLNPLVIHPTGAALQARSTRGPPSLFN